MYCNFPGYLVFVIVGDSSSIIDAAQSIGGARGKEHRRDQRCLSHVAMTYNANVSYFPGSIDLHGPSPFEAKNGVTACGSASPPVQRTDGVRVELSICMLWCPSSHGRMRIFNKLSAYNPEYRARKGSHASEGVEKIGPFTAETQSTQRITQRRP